MLLGWLPQFIKNDNNTQHKHEHNSERNGNKDNCNKDMHKHRSYRQVSSLMCDM